MLRDSRVYIIALPRVGGVALRFFRGTGLRLEFSFLGVGRRMFLLRTRERGGELDNFGIDMLNVFVILFFGAAYILFGSTSGFF